MRNGAYIRALGRMPFEPSTFSQHRAEPDAEQDNESAPNNENSSPTNRPHPPWTGLQSELASAQNDVLVTVGLCLRETHPRPKEEKVGLFMKENEVGLIVGALDLTAAYLGGWSLTLRVYEHVRFKDIARMAIFHQHFLDPFIGMPAHLAFQAFGLLTDHLSSRLLIGLARTPMFQNPETDIILQLGSWGLAFPLYEYSTLQTLNLAPKWPIFPPIRTITESWKHFTITTPHSGIFPAWVPSFALRILDSNVILSFIQSKIFQRIHSWCFDTLRRILPRPNNPDQASIQAALESDDDLDYEDQDARERRRQRRAGHTRRRRRARRSDAIALQEQEQEGSTTATAGATEPRMIQWHGSTEVEAGDIAETVVVAAVGQSDAPETEMEINEELGDLIDLDSPIRTHMPGDITANPPPGSSSLPSQVFQNTRPPQNTHDESLLDEDIPPMRPLHPHSNHRSQHRLTTLSCHPCDAAASHIAEALATGLTIRAEGIILRSIARQYLLRQTNGVRGPATMRNWQTGAIISLADMYHPRDYMGGWAATLKSMIVGQIAAWGLWEATYWASTWLGVTFFQYHKI
ncbi:hypothetical protein BGX38DRAFT_1143808 [Terfezia claveryi]|nr:hypothetical protein BGX38DRAFT_1143808 [Terfezia claveryi]